MKNAKTLFTIIGTVLAGRTALIRLQQAHDNQDDKLELLDAALNLAVVVTGILVLVRRLRRDDL